MRAWCARNCCAAGKGAVSSIARRDCVALIQEIADRGAPIVANRVAALLSRLFRVAVDHEILPANPAQHLPKPGIERAARPEGEVEPKPGNKDRWRRPLVARQMNFRSGALRLMSLWSWFRRYFTRNGRALARRLEAATMTGRQAGMTLTPYLIVGASLLPAFMVSASVDTFAQQVQGRVVRLAELHIDPRQLEKYKTALREEIEASIRLEPGVLTLYAVSVKGDPAQIRILETYADMAAYEAHLQTPHFKKYKTSTQGMVKSLVLVDTDPIMLGAKAK
jgi:quinol monooxygenase YgiN